MARHKDLRRSRLPLAPAERAGQQPGAEATPTARGLELAISRTLRYGVLLAALLVSLGLLALLANLYAGGAHPTLTTVLSPGGPGSRVLATPAEVWTGLRQRDPNALVDLGLFVLIGTPLAALALSALQFFRERDYRFVAISLAVLGIIVTSFFLGTRA